MTPMDDTIDQLLIDVRASTQGFSQDIAQMRSGFDSTLLVGFARAGEVLERGLLTAIRKGSLGFEDLQRVAGRALDQIAAQALQMGLDRIFSAASGAGGGAGGGLGDLFGGLIGGALGLPGRATGGPVSPGRGFIVGERGPELFVPTSAGRIEPQLAGGARQGVDVTIRINAPRAADAPRAMQRSSRQIASAVRRSLMQG